MDQPTFDKVLSRIYRQKHAGYKTGVNHASFVSVYAFAAREHSLLTPSPSLARRRVGRLLAQNEWNAYLPYLSSLIATCRRVPDTMPKVEYYTLGALLPVALAGAIAYGVYTVIYNVYFHPLARFPGPAFAGATIYWKAYVECIANRSFCHELVGLHARYGEMVRYSVYYDPLTLAVRKRRYRSYRAQRGKSPA